jgi:tRNA(Ile2) C34 agmatinyltransferase TiaS
MSANQEPWRDAQGACQDEPPLSSNRDDGMNASDKEQVRRDLFHNAVQQALEKQALEKQALEKQGRVAQRKISRGSQPSCTEILTSSELRFLLKQDL